MLIELDRAIERGHRPVCLAGTSRDIDTFMGA